MPPQPSPKPLRLLVLGAHPDDAEYHAGGLATRYRAAGHVVRFVSATNGGAGHQWRPSEELVCIRQAEAAAAAAQIGAESAVWDFPDGSLQPNLEVRQKIIAEIRTFRPDLVLTHRPNDYHPDHRAVGQAVQDASFLVTVPRVVPEVPALRRDPVVASMIDLFTRPCPFRPDVLLDVSAELPTILAMLASHRSQFFEWLPYNAGVEDQVPTSEPDQQLWLRASFLQRAAARKDRFRAALAERFGTTAVEQLLVCEAYEISEYASTASVPERRRLFLD